MGGCNSKEHNRVSITIPGDIKRVLVDTTDEQTLSCHLNSSNSLQNRVRSGRTSPINEQPAGSSQERPRTPEQVAGPQPQFSQTRYIEIPYPTHKDLLEAAVIFSQAAANSNITYAIVGGLAAHIYGGGRLTKSLDILIFPRLCGHEWRVKPVINELFDRNPHVLNYTLLNRRGHIVVTDGNAGVPINFFNCRNRSLAFPELVPPTRPDGLPWNPEDPEPTFLYQTVYPPSVPTGFPVPVVNPRYLIWQRVMDFEKLFGDGDGLSRKRNDVNDIIVYLNILYGVENESFTNEEAMQLLPKVRVVLRFAESHFLNGILDVRKWQWINIGVIDGDWRR